MTEEETLEVRKETLLRRKETVDAELREARNEMSLISQRARSEHRYARTATYNALSERIGNLGADSQSIQRQLGILNNRLKQVRKLAAREDKTTFESIAREMLDSETFQAIQREVAIRRNIVANADRRTQTVGSAIPMQGGSSGFRRREV